MSYVAPHENIRIAVTDLLRSLYKDIAHKLASATGDKKFTHIIIQAQSDCS
jgi:hypothetical protein